MFNIQNVTVLIVIISLYHDETSLVNCFVYITFAKNHCEIQLGEFKSDQTLSNKSGNPEYLKT